MGIIMPEKGGRSRTIGIPKPFDWTQIANHHFLVPEDMRWVSPLAEQVTKGFAKRSVWICIWFTIEVSRQAFFNVRPHLARILLGARRASA